MDDYARSTEETGKMQAIILAAGNGSRLSPLTDSIPKVMIEVCGETIIKRALNHLAELKKIKEVIIVVGYKAEKIKEHIGKSYKDMKITYVLNKDYSSTNNMYSLWLAKDYVNCDVILLEGDVIFEKKMLAPLLDSSHPNVVLVAKYNEAIPGTVITMDKETNTIKSFIGSKDQEQTKGYFMDKYKTINIYLFKRYFFEEHLIPSLENHMSNYGKRDYYEVGLGSLVSSKIRIYAHLIENIQWYEIDNTIDLKHASLMLLKQQKKVHPIFKTQLQFVKISTLKQHEKIDTVNYDDLRKKIQKNGYVKPIIVDKNTLVILDGHHRCAILKSMAFTTIPVHFVDYLSKVVKVSSWRKNENITKDEVVTMGMSRNLFPPKTSRHLFKHIEDIKIPLAEVI